MSNKFTLASVVVAHLLAALALTAFGGCKSTGFSGESSGSGRGAFSSFSGPGESGASGVIATSVPAKSIAQPAPAPAAPSPVAEEPAAPAPAPAPVGAAEPAPVVAAQPEAPAPAEAKPAPTSEIKPVGAGRTYVVKSGESIWVIARREGVSEADLLAANNLKRNTTLRAGQKLTIPASTGKPVPHAATVHAGATKADAGAATGDVYVVRKGDVLSIIARKLGTTSAALREANGIKGDAIREGQKLRVPSGAKPKAGAVAAPSSTTVKSAEKPADKAVAKPATSAPAPASGAPVLTDITPFGAGSAAPAPAPVAPAPAAPAPAVPESVEAIPAR